MTRNSPSLAMRPDGMLGRLFGKLMERTNKKNYGLALDLLKLSADQGFLEIGFGTGKLLERIAHRNPSVQLAGIDPSATMLDVAKARNALTSADLRLGEAEHLPWPARSFAAVAALNCFQFWASPDDAMIEICRVLKPHGTLLLILRDHSRKAPPWLPNPISKSGNEIVGAAECLERHGFLVSRPPGKTSSANALLGTLRV